MEGMDPRTTLPALLDPWHQAVADPESAQARVLERLLADYAATRYGSQHDAHAVKSVEDFRRGFPIQSYEGYKPLLQQVLEGDTELLLSEEPVGWAITRGTTKGESKFIPMTPTDLLQRVSAGRAMMNYVATTASMTCSRVST